jgi:hypothetical protein
MQQFTARYSTNRKRERNDPSYTFDVFNALGVAVYVYEQDLQNDNRQRVPAIACGGHRWSYAVQRQTLIGVLLCVPPPRYLEDRAVATAMLMHRGLGSSCALSHLDDITKDALLCMIVGNLKQNMTVTPVYFEPTYDEKPEVPVELKPEEPHELQSLRLRAKEDGPCFWIVRDAQNKTVVELMFHIQ